MADLLNTLLQKLKLTTGPSDPSEAAIPRTGSEDLPHDPEPRLLSLDDAGLQDFVSRQTERGVISLLQTLKSQPLQLRIVQLVTDEPTLKRVARSRFDKKLRRAAEKRLRETGSGAAEHRLRQLSEINLRIEVFLKAPRWPEARALLELASAPGLAEGLDGADGPGALNLLLRRRLHDEIDAYERTCAEMEEICEELALCRPGSKAAAARLHDRWRDLKERYAFPENFAALKTYEQLLSAPEPQAIPPAVAPKPNQGELKADARKREESREPRSQAERERRLATMERCLRKLRKLGENLANRNAGAQLRGIRGEIAALQRWKQEYPAKLDEAELLLKTLSGKRTEAVQEARWDTWARTDLATRIQLELEKTIGEIELETDPAAATRRAAGLGARLLDYAREMRELGSLDRAKDQKIWEQFKSLTDRGWAICDRMRALVLEALKTALSEHTSKPLAENATLAEPRTQLSLRATAFEATVAGRLKDLQTLWREIGAKPSAGNREVEAAGTRLFEGYFRQLNMHHGRIKRAETDAAQTCRALLEQMRIACEGKSSLLSRTQVAKGYEGRWKKSGLPGAAAQELRDQFEGYQRRFDAELDADAQARTEEARKILARAREILAGILARSGASLAQALKATAALASELASQAEDLGTLAALRQEVSAEGESAPSAQSSFQEVRAEAQAVFEECRRTVTKETAERALERNRLILEAEGLALSTDWESGRARLEELRALWKKIGALGQGDDALFGLMLENVWEFFLCRAEHKDRAPAPEQSAKCLKARKDLIHSLDALARFQKAEPLELPFAEEERTKASAKVLEFGLKYNQILQLDPQGGRLKETRKIMAQWSRLGLPDGANLDAYWKYYTNRVHRLLGIRPD